MAEEKTILLKVELDVAQLKKNATDAEKKLSELVPTMNKIKKEQGLHSIEYKKVQQEVKTYNKILTDSVKALQLNEKTTDSNSGSINEMREQLAAATVQYNSLSKEQRENTDVGVKLKDEIKAISDALKDQEGNIGDTRRNVGNYKEAFQQMREELKAYKGEMLGLDADSERYQELSAKAGELADKLKEVQENVAASAGGTGFEQMSNNIGLIRGDLENLDFGGVSEKMAQMSKISQSMTFKEVLGGLKNMGQALISLGKAILVNPLFLIAGAVAGIVFALKSWNDSVKGEAIAAQKAHTAAIEDTIKMMDQQKQRSEEISNLFIRRAELEGKSAEEIGKLKLKAFDEANEKEKKQIIEHRKAVESLRKESRLAESEEDRKSLKDKIKEHLDAEDDLVFNQTFFSAKRKNLTIEINKSILDEEKASNEKRKSEHEKALQERLTLQRRFSDLLLDEISLSNDNEEKRIEAKYKFLVDTAEGNIEELLDLERRKNEELSAIDQKNRSEEIARINENYKRQIEDAKGQAAIISQLKTNQELELEAVDIEFKDREETREIELNSKIRSLDKQKAENAKKIAAEIELIDAEINLLKKKGTEDEFSAWSDVQFSKIRQIEALAEIELQNVNLTSEEKIKIAKDTELAIQQIQSQSFQQQKDQQKELNEWTAEQKKAVALSAVNAAQQLSDTLFQINQNQIQRELNEDKDKFDAKQELLQNQLDNGLISLADYNAQKSALESEYNAKEKALKEEQFKRNKAAQLINATIAASVGVVNALAAPPPTSFIMAAIATALGAAQIGVIASQPTPKFAKGGQPLKAGIFGGRPHSTGGTKGVFEDGTQIEVEKDEAFFVINKKSSRMISALDNLNQSGGGVPLMEKGGVLKFQTGGTFASAITQPIEDRFNFQNQLIEAIKFIPNPVVMVQDINSAQNNLAAVVDRANF